MQHDLSMCGRMRRVRVWSTSWQPARGWIDRRSASYLWTVQNKGACLRVRTPPGVGQVLSQRFWSKVHGRGGFFLRLRLLGSLFFISRVGLLLSLSLRVSTGGVLVGAQKVVAHRNTQICIREHTLSLGSRTQVSLWQWHPLQREIRHARADVRVVINNVSQLFLCCGVVSQSCDAVGLLVSVLMLWE